MHEHGARLDGRIAAVTGAASGIGAAVTDLLVAAGAEVHALDIAEVVAPVLAHRCDLGSRSSVDRAVGELPDHVDMLFNCAGVPNGGRFTAEQVMSINWLGLRHLTERLLERIPPNGSITHVGSTAGRNWTDHRGELEDLLACPTFEAGLEWVADRRAFVGDGYAFSKEAVQYYTMVRAIEIRPALGVRMNCVNPGVTNTALADDFRRGVGSAVIDRAVEIAGRLAEPAEIAPALLFLADDASASYVNGVNLNVDRGTGAAHLTGRW